MIKFLAFSYFFATLFFLPPFAHAGVSYTVTPLVIAEEVEPRDIITKSITLTNTGDAPVTIYPTVNNIEINNGGGIAKFIPQVMSDQTTSLAAWIEISRAGLDLGLHDTKTIELTLRINPNAKAGVYHAFIGFPYGGNRDEAERMVEQGDSTGIVVTTTLADTKTSLLKLSRFFVDRFVTNTENNAVTYSIKNPGDEVLTPTGEIIFYDSVGREVAAQNVNPTNVAIAPGEEKDFIVPAPTEDLFGKYKAFLSVDYGKNNVASIQDTAFFYVFPLKVLLLIFGGLVAVVVSLSFYMHKRYFDDGSEDGSEILPVHIRTTPSDPKHHDIDLRTS